MFKELKVIKLIVFVGLLVAIISKIDSSDSIISDFYTNGFSYYPDENIKLFTSANSFFSLSRSISITDVSGKEISSIDIELRQQSANSNPLEKGLGYNNYIDYKFPLDIKSGIYLVENRYPIIVKSKQHAEITIIYPFANNILYRSYNGESVFRLKPKNASLRRTAPIDDYSSGLRPLFSFLDSTYFVNYITDLDLEDIDNYKESKVLILYGKLTCWTPKMKETLKTYISNGGNVLLMSSYTINNVCWYDQDNSRLILYSDSSKAMQNWMTYNGEAPEKTIGVSYPNGGYSNDSNYYLVNDGHPILKGVIAKSLKIKADLYSSPPIKWYDDLPRVDLDSLGFYKGDIIAYGEASRKGKKGIKGIFMLQPDSTSGKIVSLGTEDWCVKENYQENESIQRITKNAVKYLLK